MKNIKNLLLLTTSISTGFAADAPVAYLATLAHQFGELQMDIQAYADAAVYPGVNLFGIPEIKSRDTIPAVTDMHIELDPTPGLGAHLVDSDEHAVAEHFQRLLRFDPAIRAEVTRIIEEAPQHRDDALKAAYMASSMNSYDSHGPYGTIETFNSAPPGQKVAALLAFTERHLQGIGSPIKAAHARAIIAALPDEEKVEAAGVFFCPI